jgi:hypothetical protein
VGGGIPFAISFACPKNLKHKFKRLLKLLPPGTKAGLVGMHGILKFPNKAYAQHDLSLTSDPYKVSVGVADVETGRFHNVVLRKFLFQNVMERLLIVEPRTPTDSFCYICNGQFYFCDDSLALSLYGDFKIPYPQGYRFPLPEGGKIVIGPNSELCPFVNIEAVHDKKFQPMTNTFTFKGHNHKRGRFGDNLELDIDSSVSALRLMNLENKTERYYGEITGITCAKLGAIEIFEIYFGLKNEDRAKGLDPEQCYAIIAKTKQSSYLLITSVFENFDVWSEGITV